jgi:hypothetical protein
VKIGVASSPDPGAVRVRVAELQTGNPYQLQLVHVIRGDCGSEHALHRRFKHIRVRSEWFRECDELIRFIESLTGVPYSKSCESRLINRQRHIAIASDEDVFAVAKDYSIPAGTVRCLVDVNGRVRKRDLCRAQQKLRDRVAGGGMLA